MAKIPNLEAIRDWCKQRFQPKGSYAVSSDVKNGKLTIRKNGNDVGYFYANQESDSTIDIKESDTWEPNTKDQGGYVEKGNGNSNKVWKTDENGNPGWRDEAFLISNVTGVKGNKEQSYRTGNVNLTPSNIGAVSTSGDKMTGKLEAHGGISLNESTTSANIQYILGMDAFAQGGTVRYQNANDLSVGKLGGLESDLFFCARTTGGNFTGDIDTVYSNGAYWCKNATHSPTNDPYGLLITQAAGTTDVIKQTYISHIGNGLMGAVHERLRVNSMWSQWRIVETEGKNFVCGNCFYMIDNGGRKRMVLQTIEDGSGEKNYGSQLLIGAGGNTFVGAGESVTTLHGALQTESNKKANEIYTKGGENMFISADGHLYLYSNAQQIANRKGICFNTSGTLMPIGTDSISLGTSNHPFDLMSAKSIYISDNSLGGIMFGDESVMINENANRLYLNASKGVEINHGSGDAKNSLGKGNKFLINKNFAGYDSSPHFQLTNGSYPNAKLEMKIDQEGSNVSLYSTTGKLFEIDTLNDKLRAYTIFDGYVRFMFNWNGNGSVYVEQSVVANTNNTLTIGDSNHRFNQIWSTNALNSASDKNLKKDIKNLSEDDRYLNFFMLLQPKSYLFKDGESGRTHVGFISQDVEAAMEECGLSSLEFAGFCKDHKVEIRQEMEEIHNPADEETGKEERTEQIEKQIEELVFDDEGNPVYEYSLRYEEFIALNTMMIQKLHEKNKILEDRVDKIEKCLNIEQ